MNVRILKLILIITLIVVIRINATNNHPHFGINLKVIRLQDRDIRDSKLSSKGEFVFMNTDLKNPDGTTISLGVSQMLWDLRWTDPQSPITFIQNPLIVDVNNDKYVASVFNQDDDNPELILLKDGEMQLRSIPEFDVIRQLPIESLRVTHYTDQLVHGLNVPVVAVYTDNSIIVWNYEDDVSMTYPLGFTPGEINAVEDGWFVTSDDDDDIAFMFCTLLLETCDIYHHPEYKAYTFSQSGSIMESHLNVTENRRYVETRLGFWKRNDDGFSLTSEYVTGEGILEDFLYAGVLGFTPDEKYAVGVRDSLYYWNLDTNEITQTDISVRDIHLLPDNEHYLVYTYDSSTTLKIIPIGETVPVDEIVLADHLGMERAENWFSGAPTARLDVADGGQFVLFNFGGAAVIIPIEYE